MPELNAEEQMVQGNKERGERNLGARIREQERAQEKTNEKWAEMSRLLAQHRHNAKKLSESFLRLKKAMNK